jgi:hypothetical protein
MYGTAERCSYQLQVILNRKVITDQKSIEILVCSRLAYERRTMRSTELSFLLGCSLSEIDDGWLARLQNFFFSMISIVNI